MTFKIEFAAGEDETDPVIAFLRNRIANHFPNGTAVPVTLTTRSPLLDEELVSGMIEAAKVTGRSYKAIDAIPGTSPVLVGSGEAQPYFSAMQHQYCTNLDISRPNRRKIFLNLVNHFPDLHEWPLKKILAFLESEAGVDFIVSYGESVELEYYVSCPSCRSDQLQSLRSSTSHPITGFLTKNCSIYSYCLDCGLAFLNRQMKREDLWRYYTPDSYANASTEAEIENLYGSLCDANTSHYSNYISIKGWVEKARAIADLGAGKGEFAALARQWSPHASVRAIDWRFDEVVEAALSRRGIEAVSGDLQCLIDEKASLDLITAWEVLEHIKVEDLPLFLSAIHNALRPGGFFVFSTPDFENPFTHALDFWAMAPGEHISILCRRFLEPLLQASGFTVEVEMHESVTIKLPDTWFAFGEANDVSMSSKASSGIINLFLQDDEARARLRQRAREKNLGSELILVCRRSEAHKLSDGDFK